MIRKLDTDTWMAVGNATKDITQKDYDRVCEELEGASE